MCRKEILSSSVSKQKCIRMTLEEEWHPNIACVIMSSTFPSNVVFNASRCFKIAQFISRQLGSTSDEYNTQETGKWLSLFLSVNISNTVPCHDVSHFDPKVPICVVISWTTPVHESNVSKTKQENQLWRQGLQGNRSRDRAVTAYTSDLEERSREERKGQKVSADWILVDSLTVSGLRCWFDCRKLFWLLNDRWLFNGV